MEMNCKTTGTITNVKMIWWIKVKLKAVRLHPTDGVAFPHYVWVKYTVDGVEYIKKAYVPWRKIPPAIGTEVTVNCNESKPSKCRVDMEDWEELIYQNFKFK